MSDKARRRVGLIGIVFSIIIVLGVFAYMINTAQKVPSAGGQKPFTLFPAASPTLPPITCKTPAHTAGGDTTEKITSGGLQRTFLVHLAPSYGRQPQPLVISYHGYSWTSKIMENSTQMDSTANKYGFVLVYPQGVDDPPSWNAGVGALGPTGDADDVQFTRDMLTSLEKNYCINTQRVYVTGISLGAGMAYRVACALSTRITAIATVSGAYYPFGACNATRPMASLELHGLADTLAPYAGNADRRMAAVQDYLNVWLKIDQCSGNSTQFFQKGDVTGIEWTHCAAGTIVRHYRISDGAHTWPGQPGTTHVISANEVIWSFFSKFSL
jgi:polyhydroxybutyrate depolymerase